MRLKDARESYYFNSGKAGDVGRQLALGGIAVVWLLHGPSTSFQFPKALLAALGAFLLSLVFDFLQYFGATVVWGFYSLFKERRLKRDGINPSDETTAASQFEAPYVINLWAVTLFTLKAASLISGGGILGCFIWAKVAMI